MKLAQKSGELVRIEIMESVEEHMAMAIWTRRREICPDMGARALRLNVLMLSLCLTTLGSATPNASF